MSNYEEIEDKIKAKDQKKRKKKMRVTGKSVFTIKKVIEKKIERKK